jgi:hypothetical protein
MSVPKRAGLAALRVSCYFGKSGCKIGFTKGFLAFIQRFLRFSNGSLAFSK